MSLPARIFTLSSTPESVVAAPEESTNLSKSGFRPTLRALLDPQESHTVVPARRSPPKSRFELGDEATIPTFSSGPATSSPSLARRFVAADAELRTRGGHRHLSIGLLEETPRRDDPHARFLLLVLWAQSSSVVATGSHKISLSENDSELVKVTAYMTRRGEEWRCLDAPTAVEGRVALMSMSRNTVRGAFNVTFPTGRLHGTFHATRRAAEVVEAE